MTEGTPETTVLFVGRSNVPLWTLTPRAHLERAFRKLGAATFANASEVTMSSDAGDGPYIALWDDCAFDPPVIRALLQEPGPFLLIDDSGAGLAAKSNKANEAAAALDDPAVGLPAWRVADLGSDYWHDLRKRAEPLALRVTEANRRAVEWRLFMGTYKGVTDVVTKHVWPWPAFHVTKFCARMGLTPNMVTLVSLIMVLAAMLLFAEGAWLLGLLAAWIMTFLDTVDGKLARITYQYSKWGNVFDHSIDLIHPPFWYLAWAWGVQAGPHSLEPSVYYASLVVIFAGYIIQRLIEGLFIALFKLEVHVWRPFDSFFRLITARRNPNLLLLTASALVGREDLGLLAVAIWTALSLAVHLLQLGQAAAATAKGQGLTSWLTKPQNR
ncbi:CDP-alcohol phosphatidyltransferase family protein [Limibacillus sp. MBR-115]|jgi:phosphatidylglycerophosphate synthase|uniref:CDP-alcohol phosphatidyltransferase family protein n=1 Tax=Limibacillus sp. MBR-115 TaxID=3156465 RepID=UPI00339572DA